MGRSISTVEDSRVQVARRFRSTSSGFGGLRPVLVSVYCTWSRNAARRPSVVSAMRRLKTDDGPICAWCQKVATPLPSVPTGAL